MKLRTLLFTAALSLITSLGFAQNEVSILPYLKTDYSIVTVQNTTSDALILSIVDESSNETIYKTRIEEKGFSQKLFDLRKLEDGEYSIELSNNSKKNFEIIDNKLQAEFSLEYAENKTYFRLSKESVYVTRFSFDEKPFSVSITNNEGEELFEKVYCANKSFTGKYDISNLPIGKYNLILNSKADQSQYAFSK